MDQELKSIIDRISNTDDENFLLYMIQFATSAECILYVWKKLHYLISNDKLEIIKIVSNYYEIKVDGDMNELLENGLNESMKWIFAYNEYSDKFLDDLNLTSDQRQLFIDYKQEMKRNNCTKSAR